MLVGRGMRSIIKRFALVSVSTPIGFQLSGRVPLTPLPFCRLLGSVGLSRPMIFYVAQSGPEKEPHGDHKEETKGKEEVEPPADRVAAEEKPSTQDSGAQPKVDGDKGGQEIGEANQEESGHDEVSHFNSASMLFFGIYANSSQPAAAKPTDGPGSISAKQEGLSNADSMYPHINDPGQSENGEGETETVKVKGTVKPERPQQ